MNVSVIVPIYNGEADLPALLAALRSQTYPQNQVEYLLVDNGSRDRTLEWLQAAAQDQDMQIRPLQEATIQSSYAARNLGIRQAQADILVFTDADCRPEPTWLEMLVPAFSNPQIGLVAGEIKALCGQTLLEQYAERQETLSQKHTIAHPFCPYGQTANLAIRRAALQEAGLFRPHLTTGGDADLCWRILRQTAWQLHFAETAIVRHRHRATLPELQRQWQRYGRSNRYLHDLHGVDLMRQPQFQEYLYRLGRWGLKELPIAVGNLLRQKAAPVDLLSTPIGLICLQARVTGQQQAQITEPLKAIEWL